MIKVSDLKKDFPIFDREINGKRLTYLDSGATSQKPNSVINEMTNVYTNMNANVHRGTYVLSSETTAKYEEVPGGALLSLTAQSKGKPKANQMTRPTLEFTMLKPPDY